MIHWRRSHLWLAVALGVILVVAAALWLRGVHPGGSGLSAVPTPATPEESPLPTPTSASPTAPFPSWVTGGAVLLWVALGLLLALGIAFITLRWHRHNRA